MKVPFHWLKRLVNKDMRRKLKKIVVKGSFISAFVGIAGLVGVALWWNSLLSNTAVNNQQTAESSLLNEEKSKETLALQETEPERVLTKEDFLDPVQAEPIKEAGSYYSETLKAYLFHAGRDYRLEEGTVIRANFGGTVIYAGEDYLLGQKVCIDCGQGWEVVLGGLDNLRVKTGDKVEQNDLIGQVGYYPGAEGQEGGSQLHYELWLDNVVMIPAKS